jgi:hypothetical protein
MAARTTDQTGDDPVLGLIAKRKAEALARAEKEHNQLAAAAKLWAQGTRTVTEAEENLRRGREKQDTAIATMIDVGMDVATVAETLSITPKAVSEGLKRHRTAAEPEGAAPVAPKPAKRAAKKAAPEPTVDAEAEQPAAPVPAEPVADAAPPADPEPAPEASAQHNEKSEASDAA